MDESRLELPPDPRAVRDARRWATARVTALGREDLCEQVVLLVNELVTNALLHAGTSLTLTVRQVGPALRAEVRDGSSRGPRRRHPSWGATTGRGLALLDVLADRWGWEADGAGKVVWFEVEHEREAWPEPQLLQTATGGLG